MKNENNVDQDGIVIISDDDEDTITVEQENIHTSTEDSTKSKENKQEDYNNFYNNYEYNNKKEKNPFISRIVRCAAVSLLAVFILPLIFSFFLVSFPVALVCCILFGISTGFAAFGISIFVVIFAVAITILSVLISLLSIPFSTDFSLNLVPFSFSYIVAIILFMLCFLFFSNPSRVGSNIFVFLICFLSMLILPLFLPFLLKLLFVIIIIWCLAKIIR